MLTFFWLIINIGLYIGTVVLAIRLIRGTYVQIGLGAAMLLTLILLVLVSKINPDTDNLIPGTHQTKTWKFEPPIQSDSVYNSFYQMELESDHLSKLWLSIGYGASETSARRILYNATTHITGFNTCTGWMPVDIAFEPTSSPQKFTYRVRGIKKWRLLGFPVYWQEKHWEGQVKLNEPN